MHKRNLACPGEGVWCAWFLLLKENVLTDRVVKVTLQAVIGNYVTGMERARKATAATATETEKLEKQGAAFGKVGTGVLTFGAAAVTAVGLVVKSAADFEAQMSKVQAATNATSSDMDKFRNQALTAGAAFGYTATQVTEAQVELGKAGLATKDILGGGLTGVLALAASDNVELGKATQIAAVAMKQFNLEGSDIPHIADLLAAGAGKALGGVEQLGDALNQSGLVASNFGFSIEETTGLLSSFADAGLLGSDAGTSLKSMLQMLANPSKESAQLMKSLGINVEDANGQFLGAADIAQVLHDRLATLSDAQRQQALAQIFGSDAVRAATVLYKEGADGIQAYIDQNNDAGYAVEQARIKSNNLNGDLKKLSSAFQSALVDSGTSANGALRPLVQTVTGAVAAFNQLPEPLKAAGLGATGLVGSVALLGGGFLVLVPKIAEARAALAAMQISGASAAAAVARTTLILGSAALAFSVYAQWQGEIQGNAQELSATLDSQTGAITSNSRAWLAQELASSGAFKAAKNAGVSQKELTNAVLKGGDALDDVQRKLAAKNTFGSFFTGEGMEAGNANSKIVQLRESVIASKEAFADQKSALEGTGAAADGASAGLDAAGDSLDGVADSAQNAEQMITDTVNALKGFNSGQLDLNGAQRDFEASIDSVTESIKSNGQSLDITTEKGRSNQAALDGIAQSAVNMAGALYQQTGSQQQATDALESGRSSLIAALGQYGITGQAAQDYADKIIGTPTDWATLFSSNAPAAGDQIDDLKNKILSVPAGKTVQIVAQTAAAQGQLDAFIRQNDGRVISVRQVLVQQAVDAGAAPGAAKAAYNRAGGGPVYGPGTGTSDSIPAMLSNGEYVIRERSVKKYGTGFLDRVNAGHYANGGLVQRFANGGGVEYQYSKFAGNFTGLQGVSQLMSIFNDSSFKPGYRNEAGLAALRFQRSLTSLSDRSDDAAKKLGDLRSSADSLKSSVAGAVGKFDVGNYRSASALSRGLSRSAGQVKEFAALLTTLQKKGVSPALLSEIAGLGTAEGLPLARSLAAASAADIKSINGSYSSIQSTAAKAGQTVADANYKSLIASADKNARSLEREIANQSAAIQRIIARGFGVRGYADGGYTGDYGTGQVAGVVHGREFVMNAAATARNRSMLEAMNQGRNVRYMDPTPIRTVGATPTVNNTRTVHNHLNVQDPTAVAQAIERRERAEYA